MSRPELRAHCEPSALSLAPPYLLVLMLILIVCAGVLRPVSLWAWLLHRALLAAGLGSLGASLGLALRYRGGVR